MPAPSSTLWQKITAFFPARAEPVEARLAPGFALRQAQGERKYPLIGTLLAGLLVAGCGRGEVPAPKAAEAKRPAVTGVTIETANARAIDEAIEAVGTVRSRRQTVLSSKIVAAVVAIHAGEGDRVRGGQLLVDLDDRDGRAQVQRAEAELREARAALDEVGPAIRAADQAVEAAQAQQSLAEATLRRYQMLLQRRSVAPQEYDEVTARHRAASAELARTRELRASLVARREQAQARIARAEAEVASAEILLGYARIAAPLEGIVVAKPAEIGTLASPGVPLLTLEEERYRLEAAVPGSEIGRVRRGQVLAVRIEAIGRGLSGTVAEIVPAADAATRTVTVKIDLPPTPGLRSGVYGTARLPTGQRRAILVPRRAVVQQGQLDGLFVVDAGGDARLRLVKTGGAVGDRVEILSGLTEGERIVVGGVEKVTDGARLEAGG